MAGDSQNSGLIFLVWQHSGGYNHINSESFQNTNRRCKIKKRILIFSIFSKKPINNRVLACALEIEDEGVTDAQSKRHYEYKRN